MKKALALAAAALAVPVMLTALPAGAAAGAPAHDHHRVVGWVSCNTSTPVVAYKPTRHVLSCADHNSGLRRLTWSAWGKSSAMGAGTFYWNDCEPNCSAGTNLTSKATVELKRTKTQNGERVFTRAIVSYTDEDGDMQVETFDSIPWQG